MSFKFTEPSKFLHSAAVYDVEEILFQGHSQYQKLDIFKNPYYGNIMLLDDIVMLTEKDEFIYHEMLVHLPLYTHQNPEKILIIGGGDGGSIREAVKHRKVKKVDLCEIDQMVIDKSREFFPSVACEFDNPKVNIMVQDAIEYIKSVENYYDLILIDSTDFIEGPGEGLFNQEFYANVFKALNDKGLMTAQTQSPFERPEMSNEVLNKLRKYFPINHLYMAYTPTYYPGNISFSFGSKHYDPLKDIRLEDLRNDKFELQYYSEEIHKAAFALPEFVKKIIAKD